MQSPRANPILARLMAFVGLGVFIALLIVCFFIFSYIFIIGAILGLILFGFSWVYNRFFNKNPSARGPRGTGEQQSSGSGSGRIIEHDDQ